MRKALKFLAFLAFAGALFLLVVSVAFYQLVQVGEFRRFLVSEIEQQTELRIQLGEAHLDVGWILGISFRDVSLSEGEAAGPAISAEQVTARVALWPLLERKLIFDELRLQKPTARLLRERNGRVPLLDKLLNLPFLKRQDSEFSLDLRAIRVRDGEIDVITPSADGAPIALRFSDTDADFTRLRGEPLRNFIAGLVQSRRTEPAGPVLQFQLRSTIERDGNKTGIRGQGKMLFASNVVEFDKAWWDADLQFLGLPAGFLLQLVGPELGVKSITGYLGQRLHVVGDPGKEIRVRGDVEFKQFAVEVPQLFRHPVSLGDGRAEFALDWRPERLEVDRLYFRSKEMQFSLQGAVRRPGGNEPEFQLNFSALTMPLGALRDFLPLKLIGAPEFEKWAALFHEGELVVRKAGINASLSQLRDMVRSGTGERVWFDARVRNAAARLGTEGALPVSNLEGQLILEKGTLAVRHVRAHYGQSRISDIEGSIAGLASGAGAFELHGRGEVDLAEFQQQLKLGWLPEAIHKFASFAQQAGGKARAELVLRRSAQAQMVLEGSLALDNARLRVGELALSEIRGDLSISPKEIKAEKMRALLAASPLQIDLALRDYGAENGTFDLVIDSPGVRAGIVAQLLLGTGSAQDPGMVRGSVRYQGALNGPNGRRFTGNLDLANAQLAVKLLLQPLRELNGRIRIDEEGIDFQNLKGLIAGFPGNFSGRWRYGQTPQLLFDFASPSLDVTHLLSQIDPESTDFYDQLRAVGKITLTKGRLHAFEFSDFRSDVVIDRRVWRFTNPSMRSAGGQIQGAATLTDKPDLLSFSVAPKVQGVPVQAFLKWFDMATTEMTGKVNLTGSLASSGRDGVERKKNLHGALSLRIEDGTLHRMRFLVQILNLLDLSRWFSFKPPDLGKQGIRFRKITADFKIAEGVYSTQNLIVDSDDLRMTGEGKIDGPKDEIDFVVAVRPFAGIDAAINYIPLLGRSIVAIKNSFLVASFNIRGPIDDPTITPAPLSTLSEVFLGVLGIPKNIIGLGGESKEEPAKDEVKQRPEEMSPAAAP